MTDKEFLYQLRRRVGNSIIELRQNYNREKIQGESLSLLP